MVHRTARPDTLITALLAAVVALLGPVAGLVPRGMPVWALTVLVLSTAHLARSGGLARLRPDRWITAAALAFLGLATASVAWSPSPRADLTVLEIGYVVLTALVSGACIATLPEADARRLARLFVAGFAAGILIFLLEDALGHPLYRWANGKPPDLSVSESNVPKRAAVLLALLVWPAALAVRRLGHPRLALLLPPGYALVTLLQHSRSAIVGIGIGLAVFALAARWTAAMRRALAGALALAFAGVIPLAWLLDRVLGLDDAPWLFTSARHRVEIWWRVVTRWQDAPLLGQGIDASRALRPMGETSRFEVLTNSLLPLHPHNAFLQVWLELGALGAVLALAMALAVLNGTRRFDPADQPYALAAFAAAVAMASTAYGIWQAWWMAGIMAAALMLILAGGVARGSR